jgi:ABC-type transport system involved in cytochrome c biogenesis permease subunit
MNDRTNLIVPVIAVAIGAVWMLVVMTSPEPGMGDYHMDQFGALPCQSGGRIKPIDTVARTSLQIISGRQTFRDENDKEHSAVEFLLDAMVSRPPFYDEEKEQAPPRAATYRIFRVESEQLLNMLGLKPRDGFRYSYIEVMGDTKKVNAALAQLRKKDPKTFDEVDNKLRELVGHVRLFEALTRMKLPAEDDESGNLGLVPPTAGDTWVSVMDSFEANDPRGLEFAKILVAYKRENPAEFNKAVDEYKQDLDKAYGADTSTAQFEALFNHVAPFFWSMCFYLAVIVLCFISWMAWRTPLNRAAFWLALFTLLMHTLALGARMGIQHRPPVTNLYSSAIFIGWGSVSLCLFLEYLFKNGIAMVGAGALGAATMFIAHMLGQEGDTMEMLQAVLDTNFWLWTHVVCVTLGYTATFVAGFLGVAFIVLGVFTPYLTKDWFKALGQATYGVLCFATLLSFTGTVLGGIWADQSWGRFWGWDPKENGAVLIVIWNALILHARWAGLVKERGIAVLVVFGNIVTAWSWFGTNQLGVGLHAYGFNKHLATGCAVFWVTQAFLLAVGCLPLKYWWSFNVMKFAPKPFTRPSI